MKYITNERVLSCSFKKYNNPPWGNEKRVKEYASGREAIISLIDALVFFNQEINRVVLLPAYVPQGLHAPFEKRGWKIIYYPIDIELNPIWSEVEELIEKNSISIAFIIHYFGNVKAIEKFVDICHKRGVKVFEDHAHLFPNMEKFEYKGDFILYSLPKMIGVGDGAILIVKDLTIEMNLFKYYHKRTNHLYIAKQFFLLLFNSSISKIPNAKLVNLFSAVFGKLFNSYSNLMNIYHQPNKMTYLSKKIVERVDFDALIRIRSTYVKMYDEGLNLNCSLKTLKVSTQSNHARFGYLVFVDDRDALYKYLAKRGVYGTYLISNWNYIPKAFIGSHRFKETEYIIKHHFILPTAAHLNKEDVEKIIGYVNSWVEEISQKDISKKVF